MRPVILRLLVLCLVVFSLPLVPNQSAGAPVQSIEARLVAGYGEGSPTHALVTVDRPAVKEVKVAALDGEGELIGRYSVEPRYDDPSHAEASIDFASDVEARVRAVRITGFTVRASEVREPAFDTGRPRELPMAGCFSFCFEARRDCSNSCWSGSGEAVFSCGPDGAGGCAYTCVCCEFPNCN